MPIKVGDKLPSATFRMMTAEGPKPKTPDDIFKDKKVALFAVPGAYTSTCHKQHMPTIVQSLSALKAKGVDARLVYYPDEHHWILKPRNSIHWYGEVLGWLDRYLNSVLA